jgi:DNA-binding FrmR family transcriptional regulator
MDLGPDVIDDLQKRLRRAEGQIRGVQQMLDDKRDCREVVTQLSAAISALEQAGFRLVAAGLSWCMANPEAADECGYSVDEVQRLFMKLT